MTARWQSPEQAPEAVVFSEVDEPDPSWTRCSRDSEEEEEEDFALDSVTGD